VREAALARRRAEEQKQQAASESAAKPARKKLAPNPYKQAKAPAPPPALAQRAQAAASEAFAPAPAPAKAVAPAPAPADARAEGPTAMANMVVAVALMKKSGEAERARLFQAAEQHKELLEAQQQAAAMSAKADALKHALNMSEAEHARREYGSSVGMASPTRILKNAHLRSSPGSGNPGSRKKQASRTSPSREAQPSRALNSTRAQLNFGSTSEMCAAGEDTLMQCLNVNPDGTFNKFFADDLGAEDNGPNGEWFAKAFGSPTPSFESE
jgi:hypothetical protein